MNLAARDILRHLGRFVGTAAGLGLLFAVVISMQGIYMGLIDDATILARAMRADLWIVQRGTRGPFAEASRLDATVEARAATVPGVVAARGYTYQLVQRAHEGQSLRLAVVGISWPDDRGERLPLVAGRSIAQAHGEAVADESLKIAIGGVLELAHEPYRVVGLTKNALTSSGDAVVFVSLADSQLISSDLPAEAILTERSRVLERLRKTDLGRNQPALEELPIDPRWHAPALPTPPINAVLVNVAPQRLDDVRRVLLAWGDVEVYSQHEEEMLLLQGVVERAKMQLGLFSIILTITAAVIVTMVLYDMTLAKTHDIAVLKLMGAPASRLVSMVLQQAWLLGAVGFGIALAIGQIVYPHFPRRVVLTSQILWAAAGVIFAVTTLSSILGVAHAMRVDPGRVLEG